MAQSSPVAPGNHYQEDAVTGRVGRVLFAGIIMFTVGFFNIVEGRVRSTGLLIHVDYAAWGWALIIFGTVLLVAGWGVMAGRPWARAVALNVLVIHALIVHGREAKAFRR
jgi:hypothetical protein